MKKLIVFDWDGTIVDSVPNIIKCKRKIALLYDLPIPEDNVIRSVLGMPFEYAMSTCFPTINKNIKKSIYRDFHTLMIKEFSSSTVFSGVNSTLINLKRQGYILGIATSKHRKELEKDLHNLSLSNIFDTIACGSEYPGKPNPAMLEFNLHQAQTSPEETIFVGDTEIDIKFAKNAGVDVIAVTYGAGDKTALQCALPNYLVDSFEDIPSYIK